MPKQKKSSKKQAGSDSEDDFIDPIKAAAEKTEDGDPVLNLPAAPSKQKKSKSKKKPKKKDESDDDDIEEKLRELTMADGEQEEDIPRPKSAKKNKSKTKTVVSAFSMLGADSDDNDERKSDDSDQDIVEPSKSINDKVGNAVNDAPAVDADTDDDLDSRLAALPADSGDESKSASKKDKKKKNKKQKKKQAADDEDLDAILADLDKPADKPSASGKKKKGPVTSQSLPAVEAQTELDKSTEQNKEDIKQDGDIQDVKESAEESAAAKKRRKKQKQKERKEQEEAGLVPVAEQLGDAEEMPAEDEGEEDDAKKKKRKKKKDKKAADSETVAGGVDDKKKPKNKAIAAMKEALAKAKEEQERLEREEEEKIRKQEEAKRQREEEKKLKEEQRRRQREKDKERKERKKQEGKLLTPAQKADRERALQLLASRGVALPKPGEKPKKPYYGKPRKNKQTQQGAAEEVQTTEKVAAPSDGSKDVVSPLPQQTEEKEEAEDDIKNAWDDESDEDKPEIKKEVNEPIAEPEANDDEANKSSDENESEAEESENSEESASDDESSEDSSSEEDEEMTSRERAEARINKRQQEAEAKKSIDKLRAPVVCVLGHVDTGKTKILDKLRRTNVQDGEAGGITQQIGATNVPLEAIHKQTSFVKDFNLDELKVPGLLIIDTPGHESFSNLRTRGSSLCDIAILVIDIMHGLEPQTLESIQLLKKGKTPFVVALNKIDRLYGWKSNPHQDVQSVLKKQQPNTKSEFDERASAVITQLAEQSLNAALYYDNPNPKEYISLVPTSAHSGDGMGNLIALLCHYSQTFLAKRIAITDNLQCTVMEVKALPGLGTTVDVILVNGKLRNGDVVVMPGAEGPIVTHIRELLMPEPMRELRVKSQFRHHKEVEAAQGVKIVGKELDKVMAGLPMYVAKYQDEVEVYKDWINSALKNVLNAIKLSPTGVFVQASTLGSMEALLEYLRSVKVPYAGINIGPVHKKDVMKASVMVEHGESQYATILAFDVKVERDANELADNLGVKIFTAEIIYHLFDSFTKYQEELIEKGRRENNHLKVFPCKLKVLPHYIFNSRDPIIMGVSIESGFLSNGTPICVPEKEFTNLGVITSIERENKPIEKATKGMEVCIKIENVPGQAPRMYGRHFDEKDMLVSKISRESIDAVKKYWKKEMSKDDWKLIIELKKTFEIL